MEDKIKETILELVSKAKSQPQPEQALKFTQAALNLAHAGSIIYGVENQAKEKKVGAK